MRGKKVPRTARDGGLRRSRTLFCRKAAQTHPCGQRPRFLPPPRGVLPSPPFSFRAKRERAAGAVQERKRQRDNRGISAEMQCGTASRAARDLPARPVPRKTAGAPGMERPESIPLGSPPRTARRGMEPCSPVNPFFLDGKFGRALSLVNWNREIQPLRPLRGHLPLHMGGCPCPSRVFCRKSKRPAAGVS